MEKPKVHESTPDPEVTRRPIKRRYTVEYKLKIIQAAGRCSERGDIAALLRKEGLYKSHLRDWRRQYREGGVEALKGKPGPRPKRDPIDLENERLRRENEKLTERLTRAELIIEVQKKVARMLEELPKKDLESEEFS